MHAQYNINSIRFVCTCLSVYFQTLYARQEMETRRNRSGHDIYLYILYVVSYMRLNFILLPATSINICLNVLNWWTDALHVFIHFAITSLCRSLLPLFFYWCFCCLLLLLSPSEPLMVVFCNLFVSLVHNTERTERTNTNNIFSYGFKCVMH